MRFSAIWGPLGRDHSPFFAAPALVHAAVSGRPLELPAPQQNRYAEDAADMCYVKDCARAIALLQTADTLGHTTYNVGAGRATSNSELLARIHELAPDADLTLPKGRDPNGPNHDSWLDISRLQQETAYQPEYTSEHAVADYIAWLRAATIDSDAHRDGRQTGPPPQVQRPCGSRHEQGSRWIRTARRYLATVLLPRTTRRVAGLPDRCVDFCSQPAVIESSSGAAVAAQATKEQRFAMSGCFCDEAFDWSQSRPGSDRRWSWSRD
jgi:hypothetical protein